MIQIRKNGTIFKCDPQKLIKLLLSLNFFLILRVALTKHKCSKTSALIYTYHYGEKHQNPNPRLIKQHTYTPALVCLPLPFRFPTWLLN